MSKNSVESDPRELEPYLNRRRLLAWSGTVLLSGIAGCSDTNIPSGEEESKSPAEDSVFEEVGFSGADLVVTLAEDHDVDNLNLIAPDGSTVEQKTVTRGSTTVEMQILFKTGRTYSAGEYDLIAVIGESSESMTLELRPDIQVVDLEPEFDENDGYSSGRLLVTLKNVGTGPTWIYNIGFKNAPYRNAPEVIEGDTAADTTFELPENPDKEFLSPGAERTFLKRRGVLVLDDSNGVSCKGDTVNLSVVVQTPHGDTEQSIRAQLSGGHHVDDQGAIQHPCKEVEIGLVEGDGQDG